MKGEVAYLYAFDVANEIVTRNVGEILATKPVPFEIRTDHTYPKDVPLYRPLTVEVPATDVLLRSQAVRLIVRVYDVGVVSISARASFHADSLADILPFHRPILDDGRHLDQVVRQLCRDVFQSLVDSLIEASPPTDPEAYTVFCLTDVGAQMQASQWVASNERGVAELLSEAAPGMLSEMQIAEVLRVQKSYSTADRVVIDWDAALVIDVTGYVDDVLYVLELANLQLEEYRMMDQRLDRYLDRAYDDLKNRRFGLFGRYSETLSRLRLFQVDVAKLNDEVTHITKFVGDWYLARVYLGTSERFHLNAWRHSVEDRLSELDKLYTVVNSDINNRRMFVLEVLIVILFAVDLLILAIK
jgi:hypothetical protein